MMTKVRLLTISTIVLALLNVGLLLRRPPHPDKERRGKRITSFIVDRLQLDQAQTDQYQGLIQIHRAGITRMEKEMAEAKGQLYRSLREDNTALTDSLTTRVASLQEQIEHIHCDHFREIKKICTPQQKPLFDSLTNDLARLFHPVGQ